MKKFIGFLKLGVLKTIITMREFATSETIKIRQRVTVPPVFDAVEFNWSKQLAFEFMFSFATYLRNWTHPVKKLWVTALYIAYPVWVRIYFDNCKPPAKSQHSCPLRPSKSEFVYCKCSGIIRQLTFYQKVTVGHLHCYELTRTLHLGQVVVLRNRLRRWLSKCVLTN